MITIYAIHVLAAAAWVGGLPPLLFALSEQRRSGPREARDCTLDICSGFSLMAMMAVTLLVLSGIANAGFRVSGSFGKLFGSAYGDVLLKKIALVAAMLVLVREAVMRLLFLVPEYLPQAGGGIITFYWILLPKLVESGHEVRVVVGSGASAIYRQRPQPC